MKSKMQSSVPGPLSLRELGVGSWHLTMGAPGAPGAADIYLRSDEPGAVDALQEPGIQRLELEWRDDGVHLALVAAGRVAYLKARTAFIHEPRDRLYGNLPLAAFDRSARRFWRRVFMLLRLPGGRFLLGLIARRQR